MGVCVLVCVPAHLGDSGLPTGRTLAPADYRGTVSPVAAALRSLDANSSGNATGLPVPDWHALAPGSAPPPRAQEAIAYDPVDDYVVIYSGFIGSRPYNDTWTFHAGSWTNITATAGAPGPRRSALMVWDDADGYLVMFGGSAGPYFNDTWSFLHGHWTRINTPVAPPVRRSYGLAYDAADRQVVLFGGHQERANGRGDYVFLNDTWTFRAGAWTPLDLGVHPSSRAEPNMAWDGSDGCVVLFGGYANTSGGAFADTWLFCGDRWMNLTGSLATGSTPGPRDGAGLDFDVDAGSVIMYGGHSGGRQYNDTWTFAARNWTELLPLHPPGPVSGDRIAWDPTDGYVLLFGGDRFSVGWQNATWAYFAPALRFEETGLPAGTVWGVAVDGTDHSTSGSFLSVETGDGPHNFSLRAVPGYSTVWTGAADVEDDVTVVGVVFVVTTFAVTALEGGLGNGTWNLTVGGMSGSAPAGSPITFGMPNGTYPVDAGPRSGYVVTAPTNISVLGGPQTFNVSYAPIEVVPPGFPVYFNETGLPPGTAWNVTVNGSTFGASGPSIRVLLTNGSYAFGIGRVPGFTSRSTGTVHVNGQIDRVAVKFTPFTFSVYFNESGLAPGTRWQVGVGGAKLAGTSPSLVAHLANGTYSYTVARIAGYAVAAKGTVTVQGAPVGIPVPFSRVLFAVSFVESGLAPGTTWSVAIGSSNLTSNGTALTFALGNGSYAYSVGAVAGYTGPGNGTVVVAGHAVNVSLVYVPGSPLGGPPVGGRGAVSAEGAGAAPGATGPFVASRAGG